jgi:hypothetical protein
MRSLVLVALAACVPGQPLEVDTDEMFETVIVAIDQPDASTRYLVETGLRFRSEGLPVSAGDGEISLLLYRQTIGELLLTEGEVEFAGEGVPLPRPIGARRIAIEDGRATFIDEPVDRELFLPLARWSSDCIAAGSCATEVEGELGFACTPCKIAPPDPPDPPNPPLPPNADLTRDCLGPVTEVRGVPACALPSSEICGDGEADFVDDDRGCVLVGTTCAEGWQNLPPDAVQVPRDAPTIDAALPLLGPSRTIALDAGDHVTSELLTDVTVIGRCALGTTLTLTAWPMTRTHFENLELGGDLMYAQSVTTSSVVIAANMSEVQDAALFHSVVTSPMTALVSLSIRESVLRDQLFFGYGELTLDGVRLTGAFFTTAGASLSRVAAGAQIMAQSSTTTARRIAFGPIENDNALVVAGGTLTMNGLTVDGTPEMAVLIVSSSVSISNLVFQARGPSSAAVMAHAGSSVTLDGAMIVGGEKVGIHAVGSKVVVRDARIDVEDNATEKEATWAFVCTNGCELIGERIVVHALAPDGRCGTFASSSIRLTDFECDSVDGNEPTNPTLGFLLQPSATATIARARIANFDSSMYANGPDVVLRDYDVECAAGDNDFLAGAIQIVKTDERAGRLRGERIRLSSCPENGLSTNDVGSVVMSDVTVRDCYNGLLLRRTSVVFDRMLIENFSRRGVLLDNEFHNDVRISDDTATFRDLTVIAGLDDTEAAFDALDTEKEIHLERLLVSGGLKGIRLDANAPRFVDVALSDIEFGIQMGPALFPDALRVIAGVQFTAVPEPITQVDR